jgi:hypothetical protein
MLQRTSPIDLNYCYMVLLAVEGMYVASVSNSALMSAVFYKLMFLNKSDEGPKSSFLWYFVFFLLVLTFVFSDFSFESKYLRVL